MSWHVRYTPNLGGAVTAQSDWIARSTASGVVWAHDFQTAAEVDNFRIIGAGFSANLPGGGNDPGNVTNTDCIHNPNDGITGGCLQFTSPAGDSSHGSWNRPFSPLNSPGNGRAVGDYAMGGTLTRETWPTNTSQACGQWGKGYYSNVAYHNLSSDPRSWPSPGVAGSRGFSCDNVAGTDFYLQVRFKKSANYFQNGQPDGKNIMILTTGDGPVWDTGQPRTLNQELVWKAHWTGTCFMYTNYGNSRSNAWLLDGQGNSTTASGSYQPGGVQGATCFSQSDPANCTHYDGSGWWTVLVYINPGTDGGNGDNPIIAGNPNNNTIVRSWIAGPGQTSYTKWYDKDNLVWSYGENDPWPRGFNCVALNAFFNDQPFLETVTHRYAQVILSRSFIACPQV